MVVLSRAPANHVNAVPEVVVPARTVGSCGVHADGARRVHSVTVDRGEWTLDTGDAHEVPEVREPSQVELRRRAAAIAVALVPFGLAFGVLCSEAGLLWWEAVGFSAIVFTGSAQFAAVGVLGDGGTVAAAVGAGVLLNLRSLAFGLAMAPSLRGSLGFRLAASHLMIDEAMAVGTAATTPARRRHGYLAGGLAVFALWNLSTLLGAVLAAGAGDLVTTFGIDATIPASFLALLWPRLRDRRHLRVALAGGLIALAVAPITPPGVPILVAGLGVAAAGKAR